MRLLIVTLALALTACSGGGSGGDNVIANPSIVPTSPTTANLTFQQGPGGTYSCFLDSGTTGSRASTLYCWGVNAALGLNSTVPVAYVTKNILGGVSVAITNVQTLNNMICLGTAASFHMPYDSNAMGAASYCFGNPALVDDSGFAGAHISRTPNVSGEISVFQAPMVGADMSWYDFNLNYHPIYAGNASNPDVTESCTVSGTTYTCPSVTLTLAP